MYVQKKQKKVRVAPDPLFLPCEGLGLGTRSTWTMQWPRITIALIPDHLRGPIHLLVPPPKCTGLYLNEGSKCLFSCSLCVFTGPTYSALTELMVAQYVSYGQTIL